MTTARKKVVDVLVGIAGDHRENRRKMVLALLKDRGMLCSGCKIKPDEICTALGKKFAVKVTGLINPSNPASLVVDLKCINCGHVGRTTFRPNPLMG